MGIFKSIFSLGNKKETSLEGSKIIRAEYKDSKYFNKKFISVNEWVVGDKISEEKS